MLTPNVPAAALLDIPGKDGKPRFRRGTVFAIPNDLKLVPKEGKSETETNKKSSSY